MIQLMSEVVQINTNSNWIMFLHRKVFIDFDNFQKTNPALKVQRVSFLPQGQTEEVGWYFRDETLWREYGSQVRRCLAWSTWFVWCSGISTNLQNFTHKVTTECCAHSSLILFFRAPPWCPHQSAVEMLSSSTLSTLRESSNSQWALQATDLTSPVCVKFACEPVSFNKYFFIYT